MSTWPRRSIGSSARERRAHFGDNPFDVRGETSQIALVRTRENVDHGLNIVMTLHFRRVVPFQPGKIVEQLRRSTRGRRNRRALHRVKGVDLVLRRLRRHLVIHPVLRIQPLIRRHLAAGR